MPNTQQQKEQFDKIYNNLNEQQKRAVDTIEGPVMVIAGPGTGKTQILGARIGKILLRYRYTTRKHSLPHLYRCRRRSHA
jgi:DNA helicase-2/ATP-dependent DNA helicase PcrA